MKNFIKIILPFVIMFICGGIIGSMGAYVFKSYQHCDAAGGTLVRGVVGLKCIYKD